MWAVIALDCFSMSIDSSLSNGRSAVVHDPDNTAAEAAKVTMYRIDTVVNVIDYDVQDANFSSAKV